MNEQSLDERKRLALLHREIQQIEGGVIKEEIRVGKERIWNKMRLIYDDYRNAQREVSRSGYKTYFFFGMFTGLLIAITILITYKL